MVARDFLGKQKLKIFSPFDSRSREFSRDSLGLRDGSEMIVADVCVKGKPYRKWTHNSSNIN